MFLFCPIHKIRNNIKIYRFCFDFTFLYCIIHIRDSDNPKQLKRWRMVRKVAIYCRVSTLDGGQPVNRTSGSLFQMGWRSKEYSMKVCWNIIQRQTSRTQFLNQRCVSKEVRCVVCWDISRIGRSMKESSSLSWRIGTLVSFQCVRFRYLDHDGWDHVPVRWHSEFMGTWDDPWTDSCGTRPCKEGR